MKSIFVPEWGWVGSCIQDNAIVCNKFSSPLGDGLVLKGDVKMPRARVIFVPEWGWVGSLYIKC